MFNHKALCQGLAAALLISASTGLYAATTTYNYTITGDVLADLGSSFGLTDGDTITAYGMFTVDDSFAANGGTVSFGVGSGNSMTIDLNGTLLDASAAAGPYVEFNAGWTVFDFYFDAAPAFFYSSFTQFDDAGFSMYGEWRTNATVTAVPEASTYAMMLAGLGLVGCMGMARRKTLAAAVA